MHPLRACLAAALLLGVSAVPVALGLDSKTITETIRRAKLKVCLDTYNQCNVQCGTRPPGAYENCMQDCASQYTRCLGTISRGAADSGSTGVSGNPPIAPP